MYTMDANNPCVGVHRLTIKDQTSWYNREEGTKHELRDKYTMIYNSIADWCRYLIPIRYLPYLVSGGKGLISQRSQAPKVFLTFIVGRVTEKLEETLLIDA